MKVKIKATTGLDYSKIPDLDVPAIAADAIPYLLHLVAVVFLVSRLTEVLVLVATFIAKSS